VGASPAFPQMRQVMDAVVGVVWEEASVIFL
jgi:hypothetical protein